MAYPPCRFKFILETDRTTLPSVRTYWSCESQDRLFIFLSHKGINPFVLSKMPNQSIVFVNFSVVPAYIFFCFFCAWHSVGERLESVSPFTNALPVTSLFYLSCSLNLMSLLLLLLLSLCYILTTNSVPKLLTSDRKWYCLLVIGSITII